MQVGERLRLVLAPTINLDDTPTDGTFNAVQEQTQNNPVYCTIERCIMAYHQICR